jgi:hypothetical protein
MISLGDPTPIKSRRNATNQVNASAGSQKAGFTCAFKKLDAFAVVNELSDQQFEVIGRIKRMRGLSSGRPEAKVLYQSECVL